MEHQTDNQSKHPKGKPSGKSVSSINIRINKKTSKINRNEDLFKEKFGMKVIQAEGASNTEFPYQGQSNVITHPSPLYPPFPKIWEGGSEDGK